MEEYEDKHSMDRERKGKKRKNPMRGNRSVFLIEEQLNRKDRAYGRKRKKIRRTPS